MSGPAASASYSLIGSILIFTFFGRYLDIKYQTTPIFIVSGISLGMLVGFYGLLKVFYWEKNKKK